MNEVKPFWWLIIKIDNGQLYKVFATWPGSFTEGASWQLNSGIQSVEETADSYIFTGLSGSRYVCKKTNYGCHWYGNGVLKDLLNSDSDVQELTNEQALEYINDLKNGN